MPMLIRSLTDPTVSVLARRPAPIQVAYLHNPSGFGAPAVDLLIADGVVISAGPATGIRRAATTGASATAEPTGGGGCAGAVYCLTAVQEGMQLQQAIFLQKLEQSRTDVVGASHRDRELSSSCCMTLTIRVHPLAPTKQIQLPGALRVCDRRCSTPTIRCGKPGFAPLRVPRCKLHLNG
jgi:hypothetical protein